MLEKFIAPIVVGIIVGFVLLFGSDVKQLLLPEYEVTYQILGSNRLLGPEEVGRKEIEILGKKVADVYLTQVEIKNSGKSSISDFEILLDVEATKIPKLYRVFYITQPSEMFGDIEFLDFKSKLSKKIKLDKFIEENGFTVSFISSAPLSLNIVANKSGVKFKDFTERDSIETHKYVAIMSALSVLAGRLLIDLFVFLFALYRRISSSEN